MLTQFDGLIWFVLTLIPLVFIQRFLHREIQAVLLIVTRNPQLTIGLFSILFLPGVVLHELSHFLMAKLLFVPNGNFSLVPQALKNGRLQLGYVETQQTDAARDSLIGAAPLFAGGLFVTYAAIYHLHLLPLWDVLRNGQFDLFWLGISLLPQVKDFRSCVKSVQATAHAFFKAKILNANAANRANNANFSRLSPDSRNSR